MNLLITKCTGNKKVNSMEHTMKLYAENFKDLVQDKKVREYRLNDAKRKLIKQGDTIRFQKLPNYDEEVLTEVTKKEEFPDWYSCYQKYFNEDFKDTYEDVESVVQDTYSGYYTEEETKKSGCVVFTIKVLQKIKK